MFNYRMTFKNDFEGNLMKFNNTIRTLAMRSCEVNTSKKALEEALKASIEEKNADKTEETQKRIDVLVSDWKEEQKSYNLRLFGGKDNKGNKVGGFCDSISNDLYKAYCEYINNKNYQTMYKAVQKMLCENTVEGSPRDASINRMTSELLIVLGGKFNGNSKLAKGENFVSTMNKRTFKKVLFGAIIDIKNNNFTIKSEA